MNSKEIRNKTGTTEFWLREIAAQLAELNDNIRSKQFKAEVNLYESVAERKNRE
jgi:hypothetical protein